MVRTPKNAPRQGSYWGVKIPPSRNRFFGIKKSLMNNKHHQKEKFFTVGLILLYCIGYGLLRILVSSTMELDEAEQFRNAATLSLGYSNEPPLYSWLVWAAFKVLPAKLYTIILVKYCLLFIFYWTFYLTIREFKSHYEALLFTASLLLFPTYSYEFNRHLTHTILVTTMVSLACLFYTRILLRKNWIYYFLFGISIGLGLLSKYNYIFFLGSLLLATIHCKESRKLFFNPKGLVAILIGGLIFLPHFLWLLKTGLPSVKHAFHRADIGQKDFLSFEWFLRIIRSYFSELLLFFSLFIFFFKRNLSKDIKIPQELLSLRWLVLYSFSLPLIIIFVFKLGRFSSKWLAPIYLCFPLGLATIFRPTINFQREKVFGYFCAFIAIAVFITRAFIGFMPDVTRKRERIHIPFKVISYELKERLDKLGISDFKNVIIITDNEYLETNLKMYLPQVKFILLSKIFEKHFDQKSFKFLLWEEKDSNNGLPEIFAKRFPKVVIFKPLKANYLHSKLKPLYIVGFAQIK